VRTMDVLAERVSVLLVCDRLLDDFAGYREILDSMPCVELMTLVAAPEFAKVKVGSDAGNFPGTAADWKGVGLAVLLGGVPDALQHDNDGNAPHPAIAGLREAVAAGLHVYVQDLPGSEPQQSWATALGLDTAAADSPQELRLDDRIWPLLYDLGTNEDESRRLWALLGRLRGRSLRADGALPILRAGDGTVLAVLRRGRGKIVYNGLPELATLRVQGRKQLVNRLLLHALVLAMRPLGEQIDDDTFIMFPPQPLLGKDILVRADAALPQPVPADDAFLPAPRETRIPGFQRFSVEPPADGILPASGQVRFDIGGTEIARLVHRPLRTQDFELTPRAQPLRYIAERTGGTHCNIADVKALISVKDAPSGEFRQRTRVYPLWRGAWSLVLLLVLVSAEYLLRRSAGRVM
jgi:hypothetical protein